jgi:hypothetical protein
MGRNVPVSNGFSQANAPTPRSSTLEPTVIYVQDRTKQHQMGVYVISSYLFLIFENRVVGVSYT